MKNSQKGFSAVEVLIVLVIVGVITGAGWYVWSSSDNDTGNNTSNNGSNSQVNSTEKKYNDDFVSFSYPEGWTVMRDDNANLLGTKNLKITSPEANFPLSSQANEKMKLRLNIFLNSKDSGLAGCDSCAVLNEVVALNNPNLPDTKLIFTESNTPSSTHDSKADTIGIVTSKTVKVGDKGHGNVVVNGNGVLIWTDFDINGSTYEHDNFTSIDELKSTQAYKDLIKILNSLAIK